MDIVILKRRGFLHTVIRLPIVTLHKVKFPPDAPKRLNIPIHHHFLSIFLTSFLNVQEVFIEITLLLQNKTNLVYLSSPSQDILNSLLSLLGDRRTALKVNLCLGLSNTVVYEPTLTKPQ